MFWVVEMGLEFEVVDGVVVEGIDDDKFVVNEDRFLFMLLFMLLGLIVVCGGGGDVVKFIFMKFLLMIVVMLFSGFRLVLDEDLLFVLVVGGGDEMKFILILCMEFWFVGDDRFVLLFVVVGIGVFIFFKVFLCWEVCREEFFIVCVSNLDLG